jgi:hypothetical protein
MTPWLNWGLGLIFASRDGPTGGRIPEEWTAKWVPIADDDAEALARTDKLRAEVDEIQSDIGIVKPVEIRSWRVVDGKGGQVRSELDELLPEPTEDDIAAALAGEGAAAPGEDVQRQALNGAQMNALMELSLSVANGDLPPEVAAWLVELSVPGLDTAGTAAALAAAERFGESKPKPEVPAAPTQDGLDVARRFVAAFDLDVSARRDAWGAALR